MSDLNTGNPWSAMDDADLDNALQLGESIASIAAFLCRDVAEVEARIAERVAVPKG